MLDVELRAERYLHLHVAETLSIEMPMTSIIILVQNTMEALQCNLSPSISSQLFIVGCHGTHDFLFPSIIPFVPHTPLFPALSTANFTNDSRLCDSHDNAYQRSHANTREF